MSQLQRSLFLATTSSNAVSSSVFSTTPSGSSSRLGPFMAKLQSKTIQNYTSKCIPVLPFATACNYTRCSQLSFRKGRATFSIKTERAKGGQYCTHDGRNCAFTVYSHLTLGFHPVASSNASNQRLLDVSFKFKLPNYGGFGKRFFSQSTEAWNENENKNVRNGISTFPFEGLNKNWKGAKSVATSRRKRISALGTSGSTSVDEKNSSEQLVGATKEADLVSSKSSSSIGKTSKGLKEKKSGSKKKKEGVASTNAAGVGAVSKDGQSKSLDSSDTDQNLVQDPKKNLTGDTSKGSASTKQQSNKKKGNSSRKGEAKKAANQMPQKQNLAVDGKGKPQGQMTQLYPPMGKSVMVVESVTKAKVIQNYLGDMFEVLPSHGHVRDLAARSGSVRPDDDFSMVWEVPSAAWTHLKSIKVSLNGAENLILASDPDREGEAIAWHIIEMLQQQDALHEGINISRVVFHEITEASIKSALQSPRGIDANLVQAYLARRALDYLIGFNISPLLWRKLPGCQSAGRVQSAALALICDREMEIDEFQPQEHWTVEIELNQKDPRSSVEEFPIPAHLTHFDSKKLNQFAISSNTEAKNIETALKLVNFQVLSSKKNKVRRNPPMPYITSTLQQDAASKYNFPATYTMKLAQKLYEGIQLADGKAAGLITYPRTDGLHISDEAVKDIRSLIIQRRQAQYYLSWKNHQTFNGTNERIHVDHTLKKRVFSESLVVSPAMRYGQNFVSESARKYFKKVKNAQEAHEAIRPTDMQRFPSILVETLDEDLHKLYSLIWLRTMACQMEPSITEQIQIDSGLANESIIFRSTCSKVQFRGFQEVFEDPEVDAVRHKEHEENGRDELFRILNALKPGDELSLGAIELKQHFTQPPPRYSEGTLVKRMEELGIGRPSTYATTLKVLQDRNYVSVKSRVLHPEFRGRMVSAFLCHHFSEVTDYSFTADMETELDNVSAGLTEWKGLLRDYWTRFSSYCERANIVHIHQVEKMLEKKFGDFLFSFLPDNCRTCPSCLEGTLIFKVSRFGAGYFIGCDQHPKCKYIAKTLYGEDQDEVTPQNNNSVEEPKLLGLHPVSNEKILLKSGPYGFYVQLGEDRKGYLPKRASVSQIKDVNSITVEVALELLRYPITLGNHPKDGQPVIIKIARTGFTVRHRRTIASVPKNLKPTDITFEKAMELLSGDDVRRCGRPKSKPKVEDAVEV